MSIGTLLSCGTEAPQKETKKMATEANPPKETTSTNFDWMLGTWQRSNEKEGKITREHWRKAPEGWYQGTACTLVGKDTVFQEQMQLKQMEGTWVLAVSGVNEQATVFIFTEQSAQHFVCENRQNEFPKKISYQRKAETLEAKIADDEQEIVFLFEKGEN